MTENASSFLGPWSSYYVMTGSAAASLTGLMFVVITLIVGRERVRRSPDGLATFSTPTLMHFAGALLVSAILSAPWHVLLHAAAGPAIIGLYGVIYIICVAYRTRQLRTYTADVEDWVWYTVLPLVAYGAILTGAIMLTGVPAQALFAIAGGVVLLLFIGIRNAWDVVTFITIGGADEPQNSDESDNQADGAAP